MDTKNVLLVLVCVPLACFIAGAGLPLQAAININLGRDVGHGLWSAFFSFATGAVLLAFFAFPRLRLSNLRTFCKEVRAFPRMVVLFGGTLGSFYVACSVLLTPLIGFGVFYVCVVCGQVATSLLVDSLGWFWSPVRPLTAMRALGGFVVVVGTVVFQLDRILGASFEPLYALYVVLALMAGCFLVLQSTWNRKVGHSLGSPWRGGFVSFVMGTLSLAIASLCTGVVPDVSQSTQSVGDTWKWLGGAIGVCVVTVWIVCPTYISFAATFSLTILGQLAGSLLFDALLAPAFDLELDPVTTPRAVGFCLVFLGVCIFQFVHTRGERKQHQHNGESRQEPEQDTKKSVQLSVVTTHDDGHTVDEEQSDLKTPEIVA